MTLCETCEEAPATITLTVSAIDTSELLELVHYCKSCFPFREHFSLGSY